jgi:Flp pilus assembly protein TadG
MNPLIEGAPRRRRARFAVDDRGSVAIEFAFIAPLLIMMLLATVDIGAAMVARRKVEMISATLADLISQQGSWTQTGLNQLCGGGLQLLAPFPTGTAKILVADLAIDSKGVPRVVWSAGLQTSPLNPGTAWTGPTPNAQIATGQMIAVRVDYTLSTPVSDLASRFVGGQGYRFSNTSIASPRGNQNITYN